MVLAGRLAVARTNRKVAGMRKVLSVAGREVVRKMGLRRRRVCSVVAAAASQALSY